MPSSSSSSLRLPPIPHNAGGSRGLGVFRVEELLEGEETHKGVITGIVQLAREIDV